MGVFLVHIVDRAARHTSDMRLSCRKTQFFDGLTPPLAAGTADGIIKKQAEWAFLPDIDYYFRGERLREDDPGNILFGYIGASKYSLSFLQFGAGMYQIKSGTSDMEYRNSCFDDPRDSAMIKLGYDIYEEEHG